MLQIGLGVVVFTGLVLALSLVVVAARARLLSGAPVDVVVNDERHLRAYAGGKLLQVLGDADLRLPSACGGKGTCGQCRVVVESGGGPLLPTETALLSRREARTHVRLACQVPVRDNMSVRVADEVFGVRQWSAVVLSAKNVATFIREIVLALPDDETMDFRAGGYVLVESPPYALSFADIDIGPGFADEWSRQGLFDLSAKSGAPATRAYSMANCPAENEIVMLNVRIALPPPGHPDVPPGIVSSYLFGLKPGDKVRVAGPYGEFFARDTEAEMVFVGGGAGMAPMRSHILDQLERIGTQRRISFWYGARNRDELFYVTEFDRLAARFDNFTWHVALSAARPEDDWDGHTGFIHRVLYEQYLADHPAPEDCEYYLCGPPLMTSAVTGMLIDLGVDREDILMDDFGT